MTDSDRPVSHFWREVQAAMDRMEFPPSAAQLAKRLEVPRSTMTEWKYGRGRPKDEQLTRLAALLGARYDRLVYAINLDLGYRPNPPDGQRARRGA